MPAFADRLQAVERGLVHEALAGVAAAISAGEKFGSRQAPSGTSAGDCREVLIGS